MDQPEQPLHFAWKKSRHGAWAGGGFHYQHLITALLLVRQWAGLSPLGYVVPEGLDDCVIELPRQHIWLQMKSRHKGTFSGTEIDTIYTAINSKVEKLKDDCNTSVVIVLEQDASGVNTIDIENLFSDNQKKVIVCKDPEKEIVSLLKKELKTAEIIIDGLVSDLYKFVALTSSENAKVYYDDRRRISTTDIERRIFERLVAEDPSAIDSALISGIIEPIDFLTPVNEASFYLGVKAKPGHVAANLILPRPDEVKNIINILKNNRHLLITGPSGAGKSSLMWLTTNSLSGEFRWFNITANSTANDAEAIIRFVRARQPSTRSPVCLTIDEIGLTNSNLWDILIQDLRGLPEVYIIGTIRNEDIYLISNQEDTALFNVSLSDKLAENIWGKLVSENKTSWSHWREPFDESAGLMLEYVHILTQGKRLTEVIQGQIRQREREKRFDELSIIRCTSEVTRLGGEVDTGRLYKLLNIPSEQASSALKRLIQEHLVRENQPGVLGGLHALRSKALSESSHDELVYLQTDSLWQGFLSITKETLPRVVQSLFSQHQEHLDDKVVLKKIAELLVVSDDIENWTAILTGLGLATLERYVVIFISILEQYEVQRSHWSLVSMFCVANDDIPDMPGLQNWSIFKKAIKEFHGSPKVDLRRSCLEFLPKNISIPACKSLYQANKLLASILGLVGEEPISLDISPEFSGEGEHDIKEVADFLSTAHLINPSLAEKFVRSFGGEAVLFDWFYNQSPWVTKPCIISDKKNGRSVSSDRYFVDQKIYDNANDIVVDICKTLLAISPTSNAVISNAIDPKGQIIRVGDYDICSKNIPRINLPPESLIAWNVAFRRILMARSSVESLTSYTQKMCLLIDETEKLFRSYSEKWVSGKRIVSTNALATQMDNIISEVNSLVHTSTDQTVALRSKDTSVNDELGSLLCGVLGNLVPRMNNLTAECNLKSMGAFSGGLFEQANEQLQSDIWKTTNKPPLKKLLALAERLSDVSCIFHELANNNTSATLQEFARVSKRAIQGKSVSAAAKRCRIQANLRLQTEIKQLITTNKEKNCEIICATRHVNHPNSPYWPAVEIAILIMVEDIEIGFLQLKECMMIAKDIIRQCWPFKVVLVIQGTVVPAFAFEPTSGDILPEDFLYPDTDFTKDWQEHIDLPFHIPVVSHDFDKAINACIQLSAIFNCHNFEKDNSEEEKAIDNLIDEFKACHKRLLDRYNNFEFEELSHAINMVEDSWNLIASEYETIKEGKTVHEPLYSASYSVTKASEDEWMSEFGGIRILLRQAEIHLITKL